MTGKLIKYEIRSSIKMMAVIWAALIAVSVLFSLSINFLSDLVIDSGNGINTIVGIVEIITGIMYFAVFVALVVATVVMIILRFYKGLLGDEGYLMHTLPVKPWQLITSKGIVAAIVVIGSIIIAFLSIMILAGINSVGIFPEMFGVIRRAWEENHGYVLLAIEVIVLLILSLLKRIYQVYAALSIGQLAGKHRILLSLGAYIGLSIAVTTMLVIIAVIADQFGLSTWFGGLFIGSTSDVIGAGQAAVVSMFIFTAIQLVGFHVITERILSLKLNLQ